MVISTMLKGATVFNATAELLDMYRATPVILRALVRDIDDDRARRRPASGDWSVVEIVAHLADVEERFLGRVRQILAEDHPTLVAFDQAALADERDYRALPLEPEVQRFEALRATQIAELAPLPDTAWARIGHHQEQGEVSIQDLTAHLAAHDAAHLAEIARLRDEA